MEGKGTATYYEPTEKLLGSLSSQGDLFDEDETQITQAQDEPSRPNGKTTQVEYETTQAEDESSKPNGKITQAEDETSKLGQEPARPSSGLPDHLQNVIKEWGGKSKPEELEKIILQLCRWKPLSTVEIAEYVDRDRYHLVREYIRPLVEAGKLERTRPNAPSSPNQKYRTASDALNDSAE